MEAVAPDADLVKLLRQREPLRDIRIRPMERRVEARDLRELWRALEQRSDRGQIVRLVQRRQRDELLQRLQHTGIHADRRGVLQPAVNDPVTDPDQTVADELLAEEAPQMLHRLVVAEFHAFAPRPLGHCPARHIPGHELRRRGEALDLAAHVQGEVVVTHEEQRELDTRRAGIDDGDRVGHGVLSEPPLAQASLAARWLPAP